MTTLIVNTVDIHLSLRFRAAVFSVLCANVEVELNVSWKSLICKAIVCISW